MKKIHFDLIYKEKQTDMIYFSAEEHPLEPISNKNYFLYTDRVNLYVMEREEFFKRFTLIVDNT